MLYITDIYAQDLCIEDNHKGADWGEWFFITKQMLTMENMFPLNIFSL